MFIVFFIIHVAVWDWRNVVAYIHW
jgi:hypothetical protein